MAMSRDITPSDIGPGANVISDCEKTVLTANGRTAFATFCGEGGRHIMSIDRNVIFGLIALIAIGFVALIVGDLLH